MSKAREWPVRAMYILIAAALAFSLIITAAPAQKVSADPGLSEWDRVSTPSEEDWVLAPESIIADFAVAAGGGVAYAIVDGWNSGEDEYGYWLLKSTDGAATWDDITDALDDVIDPDDEDYNYIDELLQVACDVADPEFVAVALWWWDDDTSSYYLSVFISSDGGATFEDAGVVEIDEVFDLAVSREVAGKRDIALIGTDGSSGLIFRCTATGDSASAWADATAYAGWESCSAVVNVKFAPSWAEDKTVLVATATNAAVKLQTGTWGTVKGWNANAGFAAAVTISPSGVTIPWSSLGGATAGIALPLDYQGRYATKRYAWVNVNYLNPGPVGEIFRVIDKDVKVIQQQIAGKPWLTNVSYLGYIAEGKAIAGVLGNGAGGEAACCEGVRVYRNGTIADMEICCLSWKEACKLPTGIGAMAAFYVSADKAYAVALGPDAYYDEGAWSVSFDDGDIWNQLSLIDTNIDYLSDVAVSPDCNKTMLVSVNLESGCGCDSVWLKAVNLPEASEYNGKWLRTWCGQLGEQQYGLLRLAPEETNGENVYLVDRGTGTVYWNGMETLGCWEKGTATVSDIVDLAVKDKSTIYALDESGKVTMSDDYGTTPSWTEPVASEVDNGWTIAVRNSDILVGGQDGDVSYSDDGGETFTELEENPTIDGYVTVAFDSYFDTNDTIYAALANAGDDNGIYRWVIDESDKWENLDAAKYDYTGLVLGRNPGNPKTSADTGGVLYASYITVNEDGEVVTGVARSLNPAEIIACATCVTWDYLVQGLTPDGEAFYFMPKALKICGCLTADSTSKLFAIDGHSYDMEKGKIGTVWSFEDCYAKKAPEVTFPATNTTIAADPCSCYSVPFTLKWDPLCDACYYDIQIALDEDFTEIVQTIEASLAGDAPSYSIKGGEAGGLSCETTYYWRVRASKAGTGQVIHSWWSEPQRITIAPSTAAGVINLVSPVPGAQGVAVKNLGFSWDLLAAADKFDWNLSTNADLSSPVESKIGLTNTAYTCTKTLSYATTYYWQVTAYNKGATISTSAVGTFTTAPTGAFCCPQCGLCFDTQAALQAHTADAHPAPGTPFWVWIVIAIGAVLVIVVIVLIFRTRRV